MNSNQNISLATSRYGYWLHKIMVAGLSVQALWSIYKSVRLILVDLPNSQQLDINFLVNDLILVILASLISGGLAVSFARSHNQATELLQTLIGLAVIFVNAWLWQFLNSQHTGTTVLLLIEKLLSQ